MPEIPRSFWREVPCGHPPDPCAAKVPDGWVCHCGTLLDHDAAREVEGAPGPVVLCQKCGCHVALAGAAGIDLSYQGDHPPLDDLPTVPAVRYDSRPDTHEHIATVQHLLLAMVRDLLDRAERHDWTKLREPELSVFDEYTPKLRDSTYGSDEYKRFLDGMGEGLAHHYASHDHHPEHFDNGVRDMDLVQVLEMLCDWKAATQRHADGDLRRSIEQNAERFGYGEEFARLLTNTAERFGWFPPTIPDPPEADRG